MSEARLTARAFHDAVGVDDWRVLYWGAYAYYPVQSFSEGARFVSAIADVAVSLGHFPDADVRPEGVTLRTFSDDDGALSEGDIELARRISDVATTMGLEADPSQVQAFGIAVAQSAERDVRPFFSAVLGYRDSAAGDSVDSHRRNPHVAFQSLRPARAGRGRSHLDVSVPADQAEARVAAALAAGGRLVGKSHAPYWWTLASPENHGVDIAAWPDFEDGELD